MKPDTKEWVRCAEEDFAAAASLMLRRKKDLAGIICYHVQQCIEKYLKARIEEGGLSVPKVHSLVVLLNMLLPIEPLWASFHPSLMDVSRYAVHFRYPGHLATRTLAREAMKVCRSFRKEARLALGLAAK